ncbi:hypothetical protein EDD96_4907 [Streptomyces sp. Ag109_G2-6]|nr:hypothetical protein EDD96_4907 [Streptomyces sp. Ag109_G2-6]
MGHDAHSRLPALLGAPARIAAAPAPWPGTEPVGPLGGYSHLFEALAALALVVALLAVMTKTGLDRQPLNEVDPR